MMKMVLRCLIALLVFWQVAPACAGLMTLLGVGHPGGQQFFVASTGNNANPGTQASPWLDLTNVNSHTFGANDCVNLNGGNTFGGGTTGISSTTLHCVTSYGTGQATISTGNSASCLTNTNIPSWSYTNIICTGGGATSNTKQGVLVQNTSGAQIVGGTVSGVTITGYGQDGLAIVGTGNFGFSNVVVTNNTIHDNTSNSGALTAGINISAVNSPSMTAFANATVTGNTVYNNKGIAGVVDQGTWTGSGIWLEAITGGTVSGNLVHDNGANSTTSSSPVGIIGVFIDTFHIFQNEVFNQTSAFGGFNDAAGIDIDLSSVNNIVEYNYTHNNKVGLLAFNSGTDTWDNNTFRFNVSTNNINGNFSVGPQGDMTNLWVYNNTFSSILLGSASLTQDGGTATLQATFANNIFDSVLGPDVSFTTVAGLTFTGNNYFGGGITWNGTSYTTFSAWQTATGQEKIAGINVGKNVEPRLLVYGYDGTTNGYNPTSLSEYQLQTGSPMLAGGIDVASQYGVSYPATDYYGVSISSSSKVIGAGQQVPWVGASSATCSQANTLIGRFTTPTTAEQESANALVCGAVIDGWWSGEDVFYKLAASSSTNAAINWVSTSFGITVNGTCTFGAGQGYTGDGSSCWLNTNYSPSTAGGNSTLNSTSLMAYLTAAGTRSGISGPFDVGAFSSGAATTWLCTDCTFSSGDMEGLINESNGMHSATSQITGLWVISRTGASTGASYLNGSGLTLSQNEGSSLALVDGPVALLAGNSAPCCFAPDRISYADYGAGLSATPAFLKSVRVNADAIALGINQF